MPETTRLPSGGALPSSHKVQEGVKDGEVDGAVVDDGADEADGKNDGIGDIEGVEKLPEVE